MEFSWSIQALDGEMSVVLPHVFFLCPDGSLIWVKKNCVCAPNFDHRCFDTYLSVCFYCLRRSNRENERRDVLTSQLSNSNGIKLGKTQWGKTTRDRWRHIITSFHGLLQWICSVRKDSSSYLSTKLEDVEMWILTIKFILEKCTQAKEMQNKQAFCPFW